MDLKIILKEAFPLMDDDKIQNIHGSISRMIKDQQLSVEDLKYLEATDLFPHLELFQARKLINIIKEKENESSQIQHNPNSHSFCHTQTLSCNLNDTVNTTAEDRTKSINWSRIPKKLMKDLERKKRPTPTNRKALVRYFIDDILDSHENPGRKTLAKFAENIVSTYPDSLADQISKNGDVIGDGSYSLLIQMDNRVRNVKRKRKEIQNLEESIDDPKYSSRSANEYGCVAWQPPIPECETVEQLEEKRKKLVSMYHGNHSHWNVAEISMLMVSTYYLQRIDINNNLTINDVKVRWPFLAHSHYLNEHFETLTQVNAIKRIQDYMSNAANLMKYFTSLGSQNKQCLIIEMKMKKASEIMPAAQHIELVGLMTMIITTLKENVDGIFWKIEEDEGEFNLGCKVPSTPCLIFKGESVFVAEEFYLAIDSLIFSRCSNVISALGAMFAAYYIFNIRYNTECPVTLEFMQRVIMKMNPEKGNKFSKKKGNRQWSMSPSLLTLMNHISEFNQMLE